MINRGTTSAHAENTHHWWGQLYHRRNYLRARGEYGFQGAERFDHRELPPRTRRIPIRDGADINQVGTTSAHAENTWLQHYSQGLLGNYLRARGEYRHDPGFAFGPSELPPRTRRIRFAFHSCFHFKGTTSAHAENTFLRFYSHARGSNYLRARGEYGANHFASGDSQELPPRTRRILSAASIVRMMRGTTSAHAENTFSEEHAPEPFGNYLRARGEYCSTATANSGARELPPRTRRIRGFFTDKPVDFGTTSAHAENTRL